MVNRFFILLIGIAFVGCSKSVELTQENLQGNWCLCDNGEYVEIHIKKDSMTYLIGGLTIDLVYTIENDSVTTYEMFTGELHGKMKVELNGNQLTTSWINKENESVEHIGDRMMDSIMTFYDYDNACKKGDVVGNRKLEELFIGEYLERVRKYNCNAKGF